MIDSSTGQQMLKLPPSTLSAIHRAALQGRSPAEAAALVRQIGFETGEGFLQAFSHWLEHHRQEAGADPASLAAEEFWHHLSGFFARLGWGRLEFTQMHSGVGSISSREWAEAEIGLGARQPTCHFTTGMLADLLSRLVGSDLAVLEVECRSKGDPECRFLIGGAEALQLVYDGLRQGDEVEEAVRSLG
ncbi:MAG TPA: 4-vinyl reductase [Longimicrobiaceae bacterium]